MNKERMIFKLEQLKKCDELTKKRILEELITSLQKEIISEKTRVDLKDNPNKQLIKTINRILREIKKNNKSRPILANSVKVNYKGNEYLGFTNGYLMAMLKYKPVFRYVINPNAELLKTNQFVNIANIAKSAEAYYDSTTRADVPKEILETKILKNKTNVKLKTGAYEYYQFNNLNLVFACNEVKNCCELLGYGNLTISYSEKLTDKPIKIANKEGDFCLLMPIRITKYKEEETEE